MIGNIIALTIGGAAKNLTNVGPVAGSSYSQEYYLREATQEFRVKIRHSKAKGNNGSQDRHNLEITRTVFATATTPEYTDKEYRVRQADPGRTTVDLAAALDSWETATSNAMLTKMENWES